MVARIDKYACVGPGGMNCPCCFPAPGSKSRRLAIRTAKRKEKFEAIRVEKENMEEDDD